MHLAWISTFAMDECRGGWPAAHHGLFQAMQHNVPRLTAIGPLTAPVDAWAKWRSRLAAACTGRRRLWPYSDRRLDAFAAAYQSRIPQPPPDAVLFFGVAEFLRTTPQVPFACYTDSAFVPFLETYHAHRHYAVAELRRLKELESAWLRRQLRVFTSSSFAAQQIVTRYSLSPERVVPVGIGANLSAAPPTAIASPRRRSVLFVSTDFARKGGPLALAAVRLARVQLPDLTLDVIGDYPAQAVRQPFVRTHGWIDKNTPEGLARFESLLQQSGVLLLLSRTDLTPTALCEAFAYGLPAIASAVGGIPEMIVDGESGWLVPSGATAPQIAERLVAALTNPARRDACGHQARRAYETRWNWNSVAHAIITELKTAIVGASLATPANTMAAPS